MIKISEYIDVKKRASALECNIPDSLAVLPRNFETAESKGELRHEFSSLLIRKALMRNEIQETPLENNGEEFKLVAEFSAGLDLPTLFFAASFIASVGCSIFINILSSYIYDKFSSKSDIKLNIVTETKSGKYMQIEYEGPAKGLKDVKDTIKSVYNEETS